MADAKITSLTKGNHHSECRAALVHDEGSDDLYLIYADGKHYDDSPIKMKHYAFSLNPGNDRDFVLHLPDLLDGLKEQ